MLSTISREGSTPIREQVEELLEVADVGLGELVVHRVRRERNLTGERPLDRGVSLHVLACFDWLRPHVLDALGIGGDELGGLGGVLLDEGGAQLAGSLFAMRVDVPGSAEPYFGRQAACRQNDRGKPSTCSAT
jgi:hypothetical protein